MADDMLKNAEVTDESEPQPEITSSDPQERKLARQIRIKNRAENIRKQQLSVKYDFEEELEKTLFDEQIEKSAAILDQLIIEGDEVVTNVCIGNDAREVGRREREAARRADLLQKIENEAQEAEEMYNKIEEKWEKIKNYKDPLDINESLIMQKEKCDELIKQKDGIIAMLREEINIAEKRFIDDQVFQNQDITTLVRRVNEQVILMRNAYRNELQLVQGAIDAEREILEESNDKQWEVLSKLREEKEETNLEKKLEYMNHYMKLGNKVKLDHLQTFRETRINLQAETHSLHIELENLRTACMLNTEKLNYNYQILKKREDENVIIKTSQKRKINRLRDEINIIRKRINEFKKVKADQIDRLTTEIQKLRNNIFEIEAKAEHISQNNDVKYHQVWKLNEETVLDLFQKIIQADKIIHEDILGLTWRTPLFDFQKLDELPSYKKAQTAIKSNKQKRGLERKASSEIPDIPENLMGIVLEKIAARSGFMVEKRLVEILPSYRRNEQQLIKIDNVFSGMGIKNIDQMHLLMKFFLPFAYCPTCEENANIDYEFQNLLTVQDVLLPTNSTDAESSLSISDSGNSSEVTLNRIKDTITSELCSAKEEVAEEKEKEEAKKEEESYISVPTKSFMTTLPTTKRPRYMVCQFNHPLMIEYRYVMHALKDYVLDNSEKEDQKKPLLCNIQNHERLTLSRLITADDVRNFWNQFRSIFKTNEEHVWETVLNGIEKYYTILQARHKLNLEVKQLQKMNTELKFLLKNCSSNKKKADKKVSKSSNPSRKLRNL